MRFFDEEETRVGFVGLDLSGLDVDEPNSGNGNSESMGISPERYLLLSKVDKYPNKEIKKKKIRRARTSNNKRVSLSPVITHSGTEYAINNAPSYGVYSKLMHKIIEQLDICLERWKRVFVIRFDLHQKNYTDTNLLVSRFRKNLNERLVRRYDIFESGYVWVREQERSKRQHYHFALFLDGDKVNHSAVISMVIRETWERVRYGNSVHIPKSCYYNVKDQETKSDAVYRISYLAKQRGKGYRPNQTKDYGTSRLTRRF